ncbi:MAG: hypothetical protein H6709_19010 [Kofleriaceae bacterium]|nr:hypothetical protein [Myxococcales bacterium]MCB9564816.1 hypothetical protein [Kofleriaceae bacterium]MCB9574180.1 hypothetical protein [Kofleriaceae bacterium]
MLRSGKQTVLAAACSVALAALATPWAGCGGGGVPGDPPDATTTPPDAGDAPPDSPETQYPACREITTPTLYVDDLPAQLVGSLRDAGADLTSPTGCAVVDAPFGIATAGADAVYQLDNLVPGETYVARLSSASDLAFYVVTGCSTPSGPSGGECMLFEDAEVDGTEVGRFVAPDQPVYLVVDYYAAGEPPYPGFTLDVYQEQCESSAQCSHSEPVCRDGQCVGCASDFDCDAPLLPLCNTTSGVCGPGVNACTGDDGAPTEDRDDGPAGATVLTPDGSGVAQATGKICNNPSTELDYYRFHVDTPGESWRLSLDWAAQIDLDLRVYDLRGNLYGMSFYESPEAITLTYLPVGDYFVSVDYYAQSTVSTAQSYQLTAQRLGGGSCTTEADCAANYRNQVYRGDCVAGACESIDGLGQRAAGEACDSDSDCGGGAHCSSFYFVEDADTRMVCGTRCDSDNECAGMGPGYVCTTYLAENFCVQKCTSDDQCPTSPTSYPQSGPWYRLSCQVSTGRCVAP